MDYKIFPVPAYPGVMPSPGRRERNKAQKRARILAAARDLFTEQGYAATTTQEVAARADVAAGTVFQYAASKAELLVMVMNAEITTALEGAASGIRRARTPRTRGW